MGVRSGIRITKAERETLLKALASEPGQTLPWSRLTGRGIYTANRLSDAGYADIVRKTGYAVLVLTPAGRKHLKEIT